MTINADIDRIFKEGLKDYSPKAPDYIWSQIDQSMNNRKRRVQRTLIFSAAASVAILIAFGSGFLFTNSNQKPVITNSNQVVAVDSIQINKAQSVDAAEIDKNKNISESEEVKDANKNDKVVEDKDKTQKAEPSKPKAIRVKSTGSLLAPVYSDSATMHDTIAKQDSSNLNQ
jgi:hypothetical protein